MLASYYNINQATGVSIALMPDGTIIINVCGVNVNNNLLNLPIKKCGLKSVEEITLIADIPKCVAINLNGKGILHKKIKRTDEIDASNFSLILPNGSFSDYYVQNFTSGENSFVSIMRKTEVDKWINNFKEKGFIPLNLTFGPFPIQHILSQVNIYTDNITFDGHLIERNTQSEWLDYKYTETASAEYTLKIESEVINEKLVIPYAAAFQLILSNKLDLIQANVLSLDETFRNFVAGRKNKAMIFFMLILFFILLLVNFFIFSELNTNNITLSQNLAQSSQDITDINEVSNQIKGKESLLTELGWDGNANKSKMIDQLAALLPNDVHWQVTEINPLESSKLNNLKGLHFLTNTIKVTGESERIISVNEWLARIKNKWWIKDVELESYNYNNESKSGRFVAIISYK